MANVTLRDPDGTRAKLVEVAAVVQDRLPTAVLIGGLAVVCRCVQHGRVTQDVDTVLDNKHLQAVELADLGEVAGENRVYVDGVKVDVLGVDEIAPGVVIAEQVDGARQQLFVAAHRWAADTHASLRVTTTYGGAASVTLRVASPASLVATKTHALVDRSARGSEKCGGDLLDTLALMRHHQRGVLTALAGAPHRIGHLVGHELGSLLEDAERLNRAILQARITVPGLTPDEVRARLQPLAALEVG